MEVHSNGKQGGFFGIGVRIGYVNRRCKCVGKCLRLILIGGHVEASINTNHLGHIHKDPTTKGLTFERITHACLVIIIDAQVTSGISCTNTQYGKDLILQCKLVGIVVIINGGFVVDLLAGLIFVSVVSSPIQVVSKSKGGGQVL